MLILFAAYVSRMEDTRLLKCMMFEELVRGADCLGGQEKEWMGCFLDDLKAFGINADQWTTAAQDKGERRRTADQGVEHFTKWIAANNARAGLFIGLRLTRTDAVRSALLGLAPKRGKKAD